jgi:hypothetical protein
MKRPPTWWLLPLGALCAAVAIGAGFWRSSDPQAPRDPKVCWRFSTPAGAEPRFDRLSSDVQNLESCAARLEAQYLRTRRPVVGAYQGRFIFVNIDTIASSPHLKGNRWPVFLGNQRAEIDRLLGQGNANISVKLSPGP